MKFQDLLHLARQGFDEAEMRREEMKLRAEDIQELYIILSEKVLRQWTTTSTIPPNAFENGTDEKHGHYNFHKRIEYAVNDFHGARLHQQAFYLTVVHTTTSSLQELTDYLKDEQKRHTRWFLRRNIDNQYQINGDQNAKATTPNINIGNYNVTT
eukprot:6100204-Amphidinium_carterae.1